MELEFAPNQFETFLTTLTRYDDEKIICWQGLHDQDHKRVTKQYFSYINHSLELLITEAQRYNANGYCISVAINEFATAEIDGEVVGKRRKAFISRVRGFVVDIDYYVNRDVLIYIRDHIEPNLMVVTSTDGNENYKCHCYFLVDKTIDEEQNKYLKNNYSHIHKCLSRAIELKVIDMMNLNPEVSITDKSLSGAHILRAPGFYHLKDLENPFLVQLISNNTTTYISQKNFDDRLLKIGVTEEVNNWVKHYSVKHKMEYAAGTTDATYSRYSGCEEGKRHSSMLSYATDLFMKYNLWYEAALATALQDNQKNEPPLEDEEIEQIVEDAYNYWMDSISPKAKSNILTGEDKGIAYLEGFRNAASIIAKKIDDGELDIESAVGGDYRFIYDYSNEKHFVDVLSDTSIIYRLQQRNEGAIVGSRIAHAMVYNPDTGMFEEDNGVIKDKILEVIADMPKEPVVRRCFTKKVKDAESGEMVEVVSYAQMDNYIRSVRNQGKLNGIVAGINTTKEFYVEIEEFDSNVDLLNAPNGVINLETGKLKPHSHTYKMTKCIFPEYDPNLVKKYMDMTDPEQWIDKNERHRTGEGYDLKGRGNYWTDFVYEVMARDKDMCIYLQKILGYTLWGSLSGQFLPIHYGGGENGKSKVLETMQYMLGGYARSVSNAMFVTHEKGLPNDVLFRAELSHLRGCRMVLAEELDKHQILNAVAVKNITTGADITAKDLYHSPYTFKPTFTCHLQGNHRPRLQTIDHGTTRRLYMIPYYRNFKEDPNKIPEEELKRELRKMENLREMLAWTVAGCLLYRREGLVIPQKAINCKNEYIHESQPLQGFVDDCLEVPKTNVEIKNMGDSKVYYPDVYNCYKLWCEENFFPAIDKRVLGKFLKNEIKLPTGRDRDNRYYVARFKEKWEAIMNDPDTKNRDVVKNKVIDAVGAFKRS